MILLVHLLFGAAIGSAINNPAIAILLAFLGHYFLDFLPHIEYPIENITKKQWRKTVPEFINIGLDFFSGLFFILLLSNNQPIVYFCAFFAILPDGLSFLGSITKNTMLQKHSNFHQIKIHLFKNKKISNFWRIFSQIAVIAISIAILKI
jgi:hypothetical protein